jgi:hypothetical protein
MLSAVIVLLLMLAGFTQRRVAGSMSGFLQHLLT